jgi:hypothetical protein
VDESRASAITAVLGRARDALVAALGGGDHAAE